MQLRPELSPPAVSSARIEQLCAAIYTVSELLESGADASADIAAFNADTGHSYEHHIDRSHSDLSRAAAACVPGRMPGTPRVGRATRSDGPPPACRLTPMRGRRTMRL